ncbi:hypothetical protein BABINDRAFT_160825 [Babjeviella inositovora NRRL Y-12698]|uniref:F-box domain-containing protein n=1 Tax=Babjeviella inositovora NRRL Y-12698 TaxID=984486 RepID=A0A1E3QSA2_9ASCO|nr:uncharacterized protein BABINDRAFT_160825 [Babjeviella inositovora NRRL Y-12698]ODQ80561.1 hypothetical protein BABINDRAFT_160825 [Babjeviella inositovora NRRL Y-12698]
MELPPRSLILLPPETINCICDSLNGSDRASFAQTCRPLNKLVTPRIYQNILVVDQKYSTGTEYDWSLVKVSESPGKLQVKDQFELFLLTLQPRLHLLGYIERFEILNCMSVRVRLYLSRMISTWGKHMVHLKSFRWHGSSSSLDYTNRDKMVLYDVVGKAFPGLMVHYRWDSLCEFMKNAVQEGRKDLKLDLFLPSEISKLKLCPDLMRNLHLDSPRFNSLEIYSQPKIGLEILDALTSLSPSRQVTVHRLVLNHFHGGFNPVADLFQAELQEETYPLRGLLSETVCRDSLKELDLYVGCQYASCPCIERFMVDLVHFHRLERFALRLDSRTVPRTLSRLWVSIKAAIEANRRCLKYVYLDLSASENPRSSLQTTFEEDNDFMIGVVPQDRISTTVDEFDLLGFPNLETLIVNDFLERFILPGFQGWKLTSLYKYNSKTSDAPIQLWKSLEAHFLSMSQRNLRGWIKDASVSDVDYTITSMVLSVLEDFQAAMRKMNGAASTLPMLDIENYPTQDDATREYVDAYKHIFRISKYVPGSKRPKYQDIFTTIVSLCLVPFHESLQDLIKLPCLKSIVLNGIHLEVVEISGYRTYRLVK